MSFDEFRKRHAALIKSRQEHQNEDGPTWEAFDTPALTQQVIDPAIADVARMMRTELGVKFDVSEDVTLKNSIPNVTPLDNKILRKLIFEVPFNPNEKMSGTGQILVFFRWMRPSVTIAPLIGGAYACSEVTAPINKETVTGALLDAVTKIIEAVA